MSDSEKPPMVITTHITMDCGDGRREHRNVQTFYDNPKNAAARSIGENAAMAILNFYGPLALCDVSDAMQRPLITLANFFEAPRHEETPGYEPDEFNDDELDDE